MQSCAIFFSFSLFYLPHRANSSNIECSCSISIRRVFHSCSFHHASKQSVTKTFFTKHTHLISSSFVFIRKIFNAHKMCASLNPKLRIDDGKRNNDDNKKKQRKKKFDNFKSAIQFKRSVILFFFSFLAEERVRRKKKDIRQQSAWFVHFSDVDWIVILGLHPSEHFFHVYLLVSFILMLRFDARSHFINYV